MGRRAFWLGVLLCACVACGADGKDPADSTPSGPPVAAELPDPVTADTATRVKLDDRSQKSWVLGGGPDWMESAFGSLWVWTEVGDVLRIDPGNGRVVTTIPTVDSNNAPRCVGFGADKESIWRCTGEDQLVRIDARTEQPGKSLTVSKVTDQSRLVATEHGLWVLAANGQSVSAIDAEGRKRATVELGMFCTNMSRGGGSAIWVLCASSDAVLKIDPAKKEVVKSVGLDFPRHAAIADDLWISFAEGVAQIDTTTLKVKAVYDVARGDTSIWADDDSVWARGDDEQFLVRIDPTAQQVTEIVETSDLLGLGDVVVAGGSVWATAEEQGVLVQLPARP